MRKYLIERLNALRSLFVIRHLKSCDHGFEISEVVNTKIDPACKKCGQKMSALANNNQT